ncbi:MAG: GNAT family N-acetyltransferase [Pseudomonadota bacterium]
MGEIDLNAVDPDHQGSGVGAWMYAYALDRMKEAGMLVASVGTGGDPSHAPARRAYEKAGFGPAIPSVHLYSRCRHPDARSARFQTLRRYLPLMSATAALKSGCWTITSA